MRVFLPIVFSLLCLIVEVRAQNTINDVSVVYRDESKPWFYSDTSFFCKYSSVQKVDFFVSNDKKKIVAARKALDVEDRNILTQFLWPEDAIPGWKIDKPENNKKDSFIRTYYWGDTTKLKVAFQLEVKFEKRGAILSYIETSDELNKGFLKSLKSYFLEMREDKSARRGKADLIKNFDKRLAEWDRISKEDNRVVFEPELKYSDKRTAGDKWFYDEHFKIDKVSAMEKRIWWNPESFPQKLHYWYANGNFQKVYDILLKTGLCKQDAMGGYSISHLWWNCRFQLGYFNEIIARVKSGSLADNYFESIFLSGRINEPNVFTPIPFEYIPYECFVYLNNKEAAVKKRTDLKNDEYFKSLEKTLKEEGENSLRPQYFAYHYTILEEYEKAFHFHKLASDLEGQLTTLILSGKYEGVSNLSNDFLVQPTISANQKARILCLDLVAEILGRGHNKNLKKNKLIDYLKSDELIRNTRFNTILLEGWIKNFIQIDDSVKDEALVAIQLTKEKINVIPK